MLRRQLLRSVKNLPLLPCARTSFVPTVTRTPLNFDDAAQALSAKTTPELVRAKLVLDICSIPFFVNHGRKLLKLSEDILGPGITHWLLRKTFFGHFCAGEDASEVQQTVNRLSSSGIGAILDYAAEKGTNLSAISSDLLRLSKGQYPVGRSNQCTNFRLWFWGMLTNSAEMTQDRVHVIATFEWLSHVSEQLHQHQTGTDYAFLAKIDNEQICGTEDDGTGWCCRSRARYKHIA